MTSETSSESFTAQKEAYQRYFELFASAFDELHDAVTKHAQRKGQYIGPHHEYPNMSLLDSGFPHFTEAGFHNDNSPRDYVGIIQPNGLLGLLSGIGRPLVDLPKGVNSHPSCAVTKSAKG